MSVKVIQRNSIDDFLPYIYDFSPHKREIYSVFKKMALGLLAAQSSSIAGDD